MVDAVLSVAVDPSGVEQGARVVRRSLEDIDRSANSSMSAMDRYNAHLGKGASAAEIFQRQMQTLDAQVRAAEQAVLAQTRVTDQLGVKFGELRNASKSAVSAFQELGRTKFTGELTSQLYRLAYDMVGVMDRGGKGAVSAARASQREIITIAKSHMDEQLALVREEAQKRVAGAQAEWERIKELHKGAKTEIAAQERDAAEKALADAKTTAAQSAAAAKQANAEILADLKASTEQIITIKKEENRVAADLVRADEQLKRTTTELDGSLNRLLATEQQYNAMLVATEASEKRLNDLAGQVVEREKKKTAAIDATTTSLKEQMALQIPNGYAPVSNAGLASSYISAPPSTPTPPSPPSEAPEEIERLLAVRQKLLASYDWETLALDRRDEALEKLSLLRQKNIIDDDAEYERLRRRISGEDERARQQAQAAERVAAENDRVADSYASVMGAIDPLVRQQQRYESALAQVLAYHTSVGSSSEAMAADMDRVKAALSPAAVAAREEAAALQALEDRLDKSGAAARRMAEERARLDGARDRGDLSPEKHAALTKVLNEEGTAHHGAARGAGAHMRALQLLVPQLNDVFVTAAMGMNPLMILIQQGPQIVDVFLLAGKEAAQAAVRIALLAAPVLAVGAAFAVAAYGMKRFFDDVREAERVARLTGNAAGVTASQFVSMTDAVGASRGISNAAARDIATAYIGTGKIGGQVLTDLTAFTKDFAVATSQDVGKASEDLAGMFSSPAKAAEEAAQKWGMFSDAQVQTIRNYEAQGQLERAQQALLEGLKPRIDGAAEKVAWYTKLWDGLGRAISNAADAAGRYGAGPQTDSERKTALQKDIDLWTARVTANPNGTTVVDGTRVRDADMLQQAKDALARELRDQGQRDAQAAQDRKQAEFNRLQSQAMNLARSVDPAITATQDLRNAEIMLKDAVAAGAMSLEDKTRVLNLYKTQLEQTTAPAKAFALEMERQARVTEASAGRARDFEQQRQEILKKRGAMPGEALTQTETDQINDGLNRKYAAQASERHRTMQEAIQDARLLAAAQASASSTAMVSAQAQVAYNQVIRETTDATHPLGDVQAAQQAKQDALTKGMIEFNAQVDASIATGQLAVTSAQRLADAQARGGDIAMARARSENVLAEQLARGVDPMKALTLAALDYQKSLADLSAQQRAWNRDIAEQIDGARRLAQAETESGAAVAEANIQNKVRAQILKEGVDLDSTRAQAIEAGTRALEAQNAAARVNSSIRQGNQDLALARAEYDMLGMSNSERERSVAIMRAQLEVQNSGDWAQVPRETRDAWIAQAGAVAEYRSRVADATEASRDFANVIGKGFEDAVLAGGKLSDILKGLQTDIERIFLRATVTKPLENWLTGTMTKVLAPAPANDNLVQPANDNDPGGYRSLFEGLTSGRTGAIGSQGNPMWVRFASAGGAALDLNSMATQATSGPVPVAVKDAGDLEGVIQAASSNYGVDANLIKAVIQKESTWNPNALNGSGAAGLMQVMPANWRAYGITNPYDPAQNIEAGTKILREKLDQAGGDLAAALSAYSGHVKADGSGYVKAVLANKAAYDQAATSTVALAGAQTQAASAASVFTGEQRKLIDAALGTQRATVEATDKQDALTDGLGHFQESLEAEAKSRDQAVRATQQLSAAQQTAAAGMVGGTQAALGGIMSLLGGITGAGTVSVGGSVISAGGPQGIQSALGSAWNGLSGGSFTNTSLSGVKSWLNSTAWGGNVASQTAPVAKAGNGMLAGGEGAQTGLGTAPATSAVSWGQAIGGATTAVGGVMQMSKAQNAGQTIGGAAQTAGGVMMMIPGLQVVGGLVALGGTLISAFSSGNSRGDPYSVTNLSVQGGRFTRGSFAADNDGDPTKWNSAVEQIATKLNSLMDTYGLVAGDLSTIVVGERNATPEQAMLQALRTLKSDNGDIAWVLANAVGDDIDAAVKAIDFAAKFRDTVALWNSGMSSIVAATQQGTAAANAFGKTVLAFLDGAAATYDVAALTAKAGSKTGNPALDKLLAGLPGYATGTPSAKSGWAVVGEEGPELVKLAGGERIWNARESAQMLAGLGQGRDDALIHIRSTDELAKIRRALGHSGRVNPVTGLLGFDDSDSDSSGESNGVGGGERDTPGSGTSAGDTGSGYGADHGGGGGFGGFIDSVVEAIGGFGRSVSNGLGAVAEALGLDAKEAAVLGGMVGTVGTAAIGGIRGLAEALGKGLESLTGPGDAPAVAGPGNPGMSPTGGDFAAANAVLAKLLATIKADPTGAASDRLVSGLEAGNTGYTVEQIAGRYSDAYLNAVRGQGAAKVGALTEDLDAAVQSLAAAGVAIPNVLREALDKTNAYARSLGVTPATEKREATERLFNSALGEHGLSVERYGEVMGVVQSLADGTFSAVGKDFQALADDMVKSMAAMSSAGMQVPAALEAAEKRMLALVAAKARIDAEIAAAPDTSTDYQKQVAQLTGYWSTASTDLVKAMEAVGYQGDLLTQKLGEGLKNALKRLNEETAKVFDTNLRSAQGRSYIDELAGVREWWNKNATDMLAAGRNPNDLYAARVSQTLSGLSVDQLNDVMATFRGVDDVMVSWANYFRDIAMAAAMGDLDQRYKAAQVSLGQLSQDEYDRYQLDLKHSKELAAVTDATVRARLLEVQAIEKQSAAEAALAEQRKAQVAAGGSVRSWLDQKNATAGTSVTPQDARDAAQAQFARDLALARGGDVDAYGRLTGIADRLLSSQEALTASGAETQAMNHWVKSSLENLPAVKSYDQQMLEALAALGGSVNVQVELTTIRVITEQLSALSDADKAKLTQTAVVLRTVEERMGRFLTDAELASLVTAGVVERSIEQELGRDLTAAERAAMVPGGEILRIIEQAMGRDLTAAELDGIVVGGSVIRSVEQQLGRALTPAEQAAIILPGSVQRVIGQQIDPATGAVLVPGGPVTRTVTQTVETTETYRLFASLENSTAAILASINQGIQNNLAQLNAIGLLIYAGNADGQKVVWNTATVAERLGGVGVRAAGGPVEAGRSYIVGEFGPEKVTFGSPGYVYPTGVEPPANDRWASNIAPIRRQDYAPAPGRSGGDDRAVAELRLLRQAIDRLERRLERNEGMDQEQRARIAEEHAKLVARIVDATETMERKLTGTGGI